MGATGVVRCGDEDDGGGDGDSLTERGGAGWMVVGLLLPCCYLQIVKV